jgi:hypothetical protein
VKVVLPVEVQLIFTVQMEEVAEELVTGEEFAEVELELPSPPRTPI